jgi:phytoene dehydrogenase-like protein
VGAVTGPSGPEAASGPSAASPSWRSWPVDECDAVVLGASYGGLVTAALLAHGGRRTIVVDRADRVGMPGGAASRDGWWIPWGRRDAAGMRQASFTTHRWNTEAAARLGIDLPLVGPYDPALLIHVAPDGPVASLGPSGTPFDEYATGVLGLDPALLPPYHELHAALGAIGPDEARSLVDVRMADWLAERRVPAPVRDAFLTSLSIMWCLPPEETSVGRYVTNTFHQRSSLRYVNHPRYGGNQGVVELYAEKLRDLGGEIRLDLEPMAILVEDGRAVGVRLRDGNAFVREIRAPVVVFTAPAYELFELVPEDRFPRDFVARARSTEPLELPALNLWMGLRARPRRRRDGRPEDTLCYQRIMLGPEREFGGGFSIWTNGAPSLAPPGQHLLGVHTSEQFDFDAAEAKMRRLVEYVRERWFLDLDDVVEWHEHHWLTEPNTMAWQNRTGARVPSRTPIAGLYLEGYTTDVDGVDYDAEACSALTVAGMVLGERLAG